MHLSNNLENEYGVCEPWAYHDALFSDEELQKIIEIGQSLNPQKATVGINSTPRQDQYGIKEESRKSFVSFMGVNEDTFWIFDKLNHSIMSLNNSFFRCELMGYDKIQYTHYPTDGFYTKHVDMIYQKNQNIKLGQGKELYGMANRKLSLSVLLNDDYDGGDFVINFDGQNDVVVEKIKGRVIAFPSYTTHEVTKVTRGERHSLVVWVMGPKWR
jgi:PKHD-type hydroxylase